MKNNRIYSASEEQVLRFYQMPKVLFTNPRYSGLSIGAKAVYSILRDRLDLSIKNNWVDENGYIYLSFSEKSLSELLDTTEKTVRKYKSELVKYELIIDKRIGQGKTNRIYILKPEIENNHEYTKKAAENVDVSENGKNDRSRTDENENFRTVKTTGQDREKLPTNDTGFKETFFDDDLINTEKEKNPFQEAFVNEAKKKHIPGEQITEISKEIKAKNITFDIMVLKKTIDLIMENYSKITSLPAYFLKAIQENQKRYDYIKQIQSLSQNETAAAAIDFEFYNWLEE